MNFRIIVCLLAMGIGLASCGVNKKKHEALQLELDSANKDIGKLGEDLNRMLAKLEKCEKDKLALQADQKELELRNEQILDLKATF